MSSFALLTLRVFLSKLLCSCHTTFLWIHQNLPGYCRFHWGLPSPWEKAQHIRSHQKVAPGISVPTPPDKNVYDKLPPIFPPVLIPIRGALLSDQDSPTPSLTTHYAISVPQLVTETAPERPSFSLWMIINIFFSAASSSLAFNFSNTLFSYFLLCFLPWWQKYPHLDSLNRRPSLLSGRDKCIGRIELRIASYIIWCRLLCVQAEKRMVELCLLDPNCRIWQEWTSSQLDSTAFVPVDLKDTLFMACLTVENAVKFYADGRRCSMAWPW